MSTRIQRRGGTASEHETFTGAPREITVDTTSNGLRVHDGVTPGGHPVLMQREAGRLGGYRNKIINGDFDIWQRGDTGFAAAGYCADRWFWRPSTGGTGSVARSGIAPEGIAEIPGAPRNFIRIDHTAAGTESCYLEQRVEGVDTLAGQEATVTAYVKPDAATDVSIEVIQSFGTGGAPSAPVQTDVLPAISCPPGGWSKIQVRFTLPSVAGKTLGSDGNDHVALRFNFDPAAVFTMRMAHVSLVKGDATMEDDPFEPRHKQQELALCQRYYKELGTGLTGVVASTVQVIFSTTFENEMRAPPTITLLESSPYIGSVGNTYTGSSSVIDDSGSNSMGFYVRLNGFSGLVLGSMAYVRQIANIFCLDSEL